MKKAGRDLSRLILQAEKEGIKRHVAAAIINRGNKVLLLKRKRSDFMGGIYELPSGKIESGELLSKGLEREVEEETGLKTQSISKCIGTFDYLSRSGSLTRQFNFLINVNNADPVIDSSEHENYAWVGVNEIDRFNISEKVRKLLCEFWRQK